MAFAKHSFGRASIPINKGFGPARTAPHRHVHSTCVAERIIHGKKVAVVGCGPAALAAAAQLATLGGVVQIFTGTEGSSSTQREETKRTNEKMKWPVLISARAAEDIQASGICLDLQHENKCDTHCVHSRVSVM